MTPRRLLGWMRAPSAQALNDRSPPGAETALGRLHSMASGSFRDAKLERPVSGAELRRLLVASRPNAAVELLGKLSFNVAHQPPAEPVGRMVCWASAIGPPSCRCEMISGWKALLRRR